MLYHVSYRDDLNKAGSITKYDNDYLDDVLFFSYRVGHHQGCKHVYSFEEEVDLIDAAFLYYHVDPEPEAIEDVINTIETLGGEKIENSEAWDLITEQISTYNLLSDIEGVAWIELILHINRIQAQLAKRLGYDGFKLSNGGDAIAIPMSGRETDLKFVKKIED